MLYLGQSEEAMHFEAISSGVRSCLAIRHELWMITDISTRGARALRVQFPSRGQDVTITQTGDYSNHFLEVRVTKDDVPQRTAYLNGGYLISHRLMQTVAVELSALDVIFRQTTGAKTGRKPNPKIKRGAFSKEDHHLALLAERLKVTFAELGGYPAPADYGGYEENPDHGGTSGRKTRYNLTNAAGKQMSLSVRSTPRAADERFPIDLLAQFNEHDEFLVIAAETKPPGKRIVTVRFTDAREKTVEMKLCGGSLATVAERQAASEVEAAAITTMLRQRGRWSASSLAA